MASIVLLMDHCISKVSSQQENACAEVVDAFRILEKAKAFSATAATLLDSLMHVFRKHQVAPPKYVAEQTSNGFKGTESFAVTYNESLLSTPPMNSLGMPETDECNNFNTVTGPVSEESSSSYFAELAHSFEQGNEMDGFDWDGIFSELNTSFI